MQLIPGHFFLHNCIPAIISGHLIPVDICHTVQTLSAKLQPRKVLFLNTTGGFTDELNEVSFLGGPAKLLAVSGFNDIGILL